MNSIGVFRCAAACVSGRLLGMLACVVCCCGLAIAADCDAGLNPQEKIAQFKRLDREAERAVQQMRPTDAVRLYREAVCLVPESARGFYGLGVAEAAAGEFLEARESLRTADRLQPGTGMPLLMQVKVNFSLKDMDMLKSNLREAAGRFPGDAQLHSTLARFLAEQNLLVLALAEAVRADASADDVNSKLQLAALENAVGASEDSLHNALAVEQNHDLKTEVRASAAGLAGLSYERLHQAGQGVRYLKESIELDPSQENSYLALADLLEQMQKYAEAVDVLERARQRFPDSMAALLPLGADLVRSERYKEGVEVLRELLRVAPNTDQAYISIADAERKTGNTTGELATLRELSRQKPEYPMIHILIARAMLNEERVDYPQVLDELSLASKSGPADPDVFFLRGKVYVALDRYGEAVTALERAIELRPMEPSPYYQLARVYQKIGKTDLAREQFERVKYLEQAGAK